MFAAMTQMTTAALIALSLSLASLAAPVLAQAGGTQPAPAAKPAPPPFPSPGEIVAAAPAGDWREIAATDLLVMDLALDARGKPRRVVIQLAPAPFAQGWVANIRKLVAARWWDDATVYRVQDNYVAQWGDATEKKALPEGLAVMPESDYTAPRAEGRGSIEIASDGGRVDLHATIRGFDRGWPVLYDDNLAWLPHCYAMVGVARDMSPNTGSGAELYTVIGHAPRHLDRNIALVGRVVAGIEHLSSLPRGTGALGFYETAEERTPITRVRLASEQAESERPRFAWLATDSAAFLAYAEARKNRRDPFFIRPAGGADICNIPVPVKAVE